MSIYDFEVKDGDGNMVSLGQYRDKVLLIVNSATKCGFTPQYTELNEIYAQFNERGFEILDFPCNQFGSGSWNHRRDYQRLPHKMVSSIHNF